jgi:hypothetical protein
MEGSWRRGRTTLQPSARPALWFLLAGKSGRDYVSHLKAIRFPATLVVPGQLQDHLELGSPIRASEHRHLEQAASRDTGPQIEGTPVLVFDGFTRARYVELDVGDDADGEQNLGNAGIVRGGPNGASDYPALTEGLLRDPL